MAPPPTRLRTPDEEAIADRTVFDETDEALEAESADIDRLNGYAVAGVELASGSGATPTPATTKKGNNAFFNPNPGYVPNTSQAKLSWASPEQLAFAESVALRVTGNKKTKLEPLKRPKRDWTWEVDGTYPTTSKGEKIPNFKAPQLADYCYKKIVVFSPLEQFPEDCANVKCPSCGKANTWNKAGLSNNFRNAFGVSDREMVIGRKYKCERNNGCNKVFNAWNPSFFAALPDIAQNDFPYLTNLDENNTAMFIHKDLVDKILSEHHQIGYAGLYKSIRRPYFHSFLQKMVSFTAALKAFKDRGFVPVPGRLTQPTISSFAAAKSPGEPLAGRPILDENIPTLRDYCINPHCYNGGWPTYSFLRDFVIKQHQKIIQPICDRVQRNVTGKTLAYDVHKKMTKYAQVEGNQPFAGLGATMTETKEVPVWGLLAREAEEDVKEMVGDYPQRLEAKDIRLSAMFLDNCCSFARIFRDIFGDQSLGVFLDRAHIMFRYSDLVSTDHPQRETFLKELSHCFAFKEQVPADMRFPVRTNKDRNFVTRSYEAAEVEQKLSHMIETLSTNVPPFFDHSAMLAMHENQLIHVTKGCVLFGAKSRNDEYCIRREGSVGFLTPQGTSSLENMFRWIMAGNSKVPVGPGTTIMRLELAFLNVNVTSGSQIRGDKFLQQSGGASIRFDFIDYILNEQRSMFPLLAANFPLWPGEFGKPIPKVSASLDPKKIELIGTGVIPEVVRALAPKSALPRAVPKASQVTEFTSSDLLYEERAVSISAESTQAQFGDRDRPLLCHRTSATEFLSDNNIEHVLLSGLTDNEKVLADTLLSLTKLSSKSNDTAFQRMFLLWNANSDVIDSVDIRILSHWTILKTIVKNREKAATYRAAIASRPVVPMQYTPPLSNTGPPIPSHSPMLHNSHSGGQFIQHPLLRPPMFSNSNFNQYPHDFSNPLLDPPRTVFTRIIPSQPVNARKKPTCSRCSKLTSGHNISFCADGVRAVDSAKHLFGVVYDSQWFETVYFPYLAGKGKEAQLVQQCLKVLKEKQPDIYSSLENNPAVNVFL